MFDIDAICSSNMRYKLGEHNIDMLISWAKSFFVENVIFCL